VFFYRVYFSLNIKAKLQWRCRRGMLELDLLLGRFMETQFDKLTPVQCLDFEILLHYPDPEIQAWILEQEIPPSEALNELVRLIRQASYHG
jgi:antitoxin CptB